MDPSQPRDPDEPPSAPSETPPPPPAQSWQSPPQQPAPPMGGGTPPASGQPQWMSNLTSQQPVAGPAGFYYADVPNRAIAYIIDAIIIGIIGVVVGIVIYGIVGPATTFDINTLGTGVNLASLLIVTLVGLAINAAYFLYTWVNMRATIGMRLLGMQIGHEADGRTLTYEQAAIRWVLLGAPFGLAQLLNPWPGLGLLISLLGFVWLIVLLYTTAQSPTKQGLHDRYAHTMVVKAGRSVG
jgi:uncharacterized RDD family membrane protein YckC